MPTILPAGCGAALVERSAWRRVLSRPARGKSRGFASLPIQPVHPAIRTCTTRIHQRTICLEVGINSFSLAIATITFSFSEDDVLHYAMQFPVGYGLLFLVYSPLMTAFFRFYLARKDPLGEEEASKTTVNDYDEEETLQRSLLYDTDSQ